MQNIYSNPSELEHLAKEKYAVPPFLMMENAAKAVADFILDFSPEHVVILCGKGNNGGDGYAAARLLQEKCDITVVVLEPPAAEEVKAQYEMCRQLDIEITDANRWLSSPKGVSKPSLSEPQIILDCIYGTGFHGELPDAVKKLLGTANKSNAIKIACDIPSGLYFQADYTITMGCQKLSLYSDKAKAVCGKIIVADLGIARNKFETTTTAAHLVEPQDITLPLRKNRAAHKGSYGHTAVLCGEKSGAAILAASAAMSFGSGLTTLVETEKSNLSQFKISPSLMLSKALPNKTSAILLGSGFTEYNEGAAALLKDWFERNKNPACVLDAGILTAPEFPALLAQLNSFENARIILTPHLAELSKLLENLKLQELSSQEISVESLANNTEIKIKAGKLLNAQFAKTTVIMKSANTFIADGGEAFVIADGTQSLAKGGSGDLLAGMAAALLAQGYTSRSAAITAAEHHALTAHKLGEQSYNFTPELFLSLY